MTILRVYDPHECDERGIPLDWERCRECAARLSRMLDVPLHREAAISVLYTEAQTREECATCLTCDGHGSLKAAALHYLTFRYEHGRLSGKPFRHRCEDCGHPMSEGTWEGDTQGYDAAAWLRVGEGHFIEGDELGPGVPVHYSPCDEGCRHGDEGKRWNLDGVVVYGSPEQKARGKPPIEASWRQVDVRTLGWPHDLRPEKLAVLCLRCWAARS